MLLRKSASWLELIQRIDYPELLSHLPPDPYSETLPLHFTNLRRWDGRLPPISLTEVLYTYLISKKLLETEIYRKTTSLDHQHPDQFFKPTVKCTKAAIVLNNLGHIKLSRILE